MSQRSHLWRGAKEPRFFRPPQSVVVDTQGDPIAEMGNLFDVAMLIGVGFLITAMSSFGLKGVIANEDFTLVKSPGTQDMEVIVREQGQIKRFKPSDQSVSGPGSAVGTVYRLNDGTLVWSPNTLDGQ